jgi:hypothetical protein
LVAAAIVLWNTTYLEHAVESLKAHRYGVDESLLQQGIMFGQQVNAFRRRNAGRFDLIGYRGP